MGSNRRAMMDLTDNDLKVLNSLAANLWWDGHMDTTEASIIAGMLVQQWLDYEHNREISRNCQNLIRACWS